MGKISVADIQKWNPDEIAAVFGVSRDVSDHSRMTALRVNNLPAFESWQGIAADDAKKATEKTRKALELHGDIAAGVADAARAAELEVIQVKANLKKLIAACDAEGFVLDPDDDTITPLVPIMGPFTPDEEAGVALKREQQANLVKSLATLLTEADQADKDLAKAIAAAAGVRDEGVSLRPTSNDVVLGSVSTFVGANTDIITDIWRASLGEAPTGYEARVLPWLKDIANLRTTPIGAGMGALMTVR
ncbi:hypothetical protein ACLQ3C_09795 [Gordonia sp. DT30]|uniref:hypothetical protein n=1 Tax=Gordonia sp. DT30 TaxID=3416546 RepID=UPI003CF32992